MRCVAPLALIGCAPAWIPMEPQAVCQDVAYAVAARTFECQSDEALATERTAAFEDGYTCLVTSLREPIGLYYACPVAVNALSCDEVEAFGDDLDLWLAASDACATILEHADGTPLPSLEEP
jgi:hypothetical protein